MKKFSFLMETWADRFLIALSNLSPGYLIALCVFVNASISFTFSVFAHPVYEDPLESLSIGIRLFTLILFAPVIETLFFQQFLINVSLKYISRNKLSAILFSALIFGIAHHYSFANIFKAFMAGLLYGLLYLVMEYKNKNPVLYVVIAHAIFNSIGFIVTNFSNK